MVTLYKEEIVCVFLAHRTCMFVLTIALTLAFGLAHKTCICSSCLLLTSQSLSVSIPSFWLSSWLTRLVYVRLVYCLGLTKFVRFSKSPWLASGWLLKASHWRISLDAAIFNNQFNRLKQSCRHNKSMRFSHWIDVTFIFKVISTKFRGILASITRTLGGIRRSTASEAPPHTSV